MESSYALTRGEAIDANPCSADVERRNHTWALRFGLIDRTTSHRLARIGCGSFAAHTYPNAAPSVVELGANLITWLFLFDDAWGEGGPDGDAGKMRFTFDGVENLLRTGASPAGSSVFETAMSDLLARFATRVTPDWQQRFADSMARYFDGCLLELPYRRERRSPSAAEYRALRRWSIGGLPVFDLIELTLDEPLSGGMARRPELVALRERAAELCAWVNDIWSYEKELGEEDPLNLVSVLIGDRKLSLPHAFAAAAELYNEDLAAFIRMVDRFAALPDASTRELAYVEGLQAWVHGNRAWTQTSLRYRQLDRLARRHAPGHFE